MFYFFIVFRSIPIILHSLGIYLMSTTTFTKPWQKIQRRYMIWLSLSEMFLCLSTIFYVLEKFFHLVEFRRFDILLLCLFGAQFCSVLTSMTIDRMAFVWLNVRYNCAVGGKIFIAISISSQLVTVGILAGFYYFVKHQNGDFYAFQTLYLWPVVDLCILVTFVSCYIIIVKTISDRSKSLFGAESKLYRKRMRKTILVPSLIIWTYIVCFSSMNAVHFGFALSKSPAPFWVASLANAFYAMGFNLDALLYIFLTPAIRKRLKRKFCCFFRSRQLDTNP